MSTPVVWMQSKTSAAFQEVSKIMEEWEMKTVIDTTKIKRLFNSVIRGEAPAKLVAGLALGALLFTSTSLAPTAFADAPARPLTTVEELLIQAEIEDGLLEDTNRVRAPFSAEQWLVIQAELDDSGTGSGYNVRKPFTAEERLVIQAELDDSDTGSGDNVGKPFTAEERLVIQAEVDDSDTGSGYNVGRPLTAEERLMIQAELEDALA